MVVAVDEVPCHLCRLVTTVGPHAGYGGRSMLWLWGLPLCCCRVRDRGEGMTVAVLEEVER